MLFDNELADAFINTLMIGIDNLGKDTETKQPGLTVELLRILTISNSNYEKVVLLGSKK